MSRFKKVLIIHLIVFMLAVHLGTSFASEPANTSSGNSPQIVLDPDIPAELFGTIGYRGG